MPRIAVCLNFADPDKDSPLWSGENEYLDYCAECYDDADEADIAEDYKLPLDAVDKIGDEHPQYEGEGYSCECCGEILTSEDD